MIIAAQFASVRRSAFLTCKFEVTLTWHPFELEIAPLAPACNDKGAVEAALANSTCLTRVGTRLKSGFETTEMVITCEIVYPERTGMALCDNAKTVIPSRAECSSYRAAPELMSAPCTESLARQRLLHFGVECVRTRTRQTACLKFHHLLHLRPRAQSSDGKHELERRARSKRRDTLGRESITVMLN